MDFFLTKNGEYVHDISYDYFDFTLIPDVITCNNQCYHYDKIVGKGQYGKVYRYENVEKEEYIIFKHGILEETEYPMEADISKALMEGKHSMLKHRYDPNFKNGPAYFMEYMEGDITDIKGINLQGWLEVINQVREQLLFLAQKGFYYTDINAGNILYKREGDNLIAKLADFGGAYEDDEGDYISTHPPPEYHHSHDEGIGFINRLDIDIDSYLSWQIGVLLLLNYDSCYMIGYKDFDENYLERIELINCPVQLIKKYLDPNPEKRPTIQKVINPSS